MRSNLSRFSISPALVVVTMLALPLVARAAEAPKVALVPYQPIARQASPELCAQISTILVAELGGSDTLTLVTSGDSKEPVAAEGGADAPAANVDAGKAELDKALKLADTGAKNVKRQKFEPAIKALEEALKLFPVAAPALTDVTPVAQANLDLAVAYWKRGREDEAMSRMQDAIRLNPDAKLDPKEYFPLFLNVYDTELRKLLRKPRGSVRVDATVPGAEVFFDGKSAGATPLMLTNAVNGHHYLRVVKDGAGVFGAQVDVRADGSIEILADLGGGKADSAAAGLGPVATAVTNNLVDEEAIQAAAAIGKKQGAQYVIFGGVQKKETAIVVASYFVRVSDGKAGRLVDLDLDTDLLSASVEAFKLVEEVGARLTDFGDTLPPGAQPIVRGVEGGAERGITEVDVGPPVPEAKKAPSRSSRVEGEGGGEEGDARVAIGGEEDTKRRGSTRRTNSLDGDGRTAKPTDYEPSRPWYMAVLGSPLLLAGIIGGGVVVASLVLAVLAVGGGGGAAAAWYLLSPPQSAKVEATW